MVGTQHTRHSPAACQALCLPPRTDGRTDLEALLLPLDVLVDGVNHAAHQLHGRAQVGEVRVALWGVLQQLRQEELVPACIGNKEMGGWMDGWIDR